MFSRSALYTQVCNNYFLYQCSLCKHFNLVKLRQVRRPAFCSLLCTAAVYTHKDTQGKSVLSAAACRVTLCHATLLITSSSSFGATG